MKSKATKMQKIIDILPSVRFLCAYSARILTWINIFYLIKIVCFLRYEMELPKF
jgi:hypothetical protein